MTGICVSSLQNFDCKEMHLLGVVIAVKNLDQMPQLLWMVQHSGSICMRTQRRIIRLNYARSRCVEKDAVYPYTKFVEVANRKRKGYKISPKNYTYVIFRRCIFPTHAQHSSSAANCDKFTISDDKNKR